MRKKIIAILMVIVFLITSLPLLANDDLQELRDQADAYAQQAAQTAQELDATRAAIDEILQELMELDYRLTTAMMDLRSIDQTLELTIAALEQAELDLILAQYELDRQHEAIRAQLRAMQERGSTGLLSVVFQATSLRDFLLRLEYVNDIARRDQEMVVRLEATEAMVSQVQEAIARQADSIEALQLRQQDYVELLEYMEAERKAYYYALHEDEVRLAAWLVYEQEQAAKMDAIFREAYEAEQQRLAAEQRERERLEMERRILEMANLGGILGWPVPSSASISSPFGYRIHPIRRTRAHHDGIDIRARHGADIVAAEAGRVIFSGWSGGYGNTVIIDHGGGLHTLYAHNSLNLVRVGDYVTRGQVIALIGSTGMSTGPHLHFEVRLHGQVQDPKPFLGL